MRSIFNSKHTEEFIDRINSLNMHTQPQWGRMNVSQMLAHCQYPLKLATGEVKPAINPVIRILFGKKAKKKLVQDIEFKKHLPTFSEAKISRPNPFEKERLALIQMLDSFSKKGPAILTKDPHPFFGPLTTSEWDILQVKHLDHHLRQFGV